MGGAVTRLRSKSAASPAQPDTSGLRTESCLSFIGILLWEQTDTLMGNEPGKQEHGLGRQDFTKNNGVVRPWVDFWKAVWESRVDDPALFHDCLDIAMEL